MSSYWMSSNRHPARVSTIVAESRHFSNQAHKDGITVYDVVIGHRNAGLLLPNSFSNLLLWIQEVDTNSSRSVVARYICQMRACERRTAANAKQKTKTAQRSTFDTSNRNGRDLPAHFISSWSHILTWSLILTQAGEETSRCWFAVLNVALLFLCAQDPPQVTSEVRALCGQRIFV